MKIVCLVVADALILIVIVTVILIFLLCKQ